MSHSLSTANNATLLHKETHLFKFDLQLSCKNSFVTKQKGHIFHLWEQ